MSFEQGDNNIETSNFESDEIRTWNGALSYDSTHPLLKLFFKSVRDIPCTDYKSYGKSKSSETPGDVLETLFDEAWEQDRVRTLKFLFYLRDCREGKGEKKLFRALVRHLLATDRASVIEKNLALIPEYGSWKDLMLIFLGTPLEKSALTLFATQLKKDVDTDHPTLCAKYAPSECGAAQKKHKAALKLAKLLKSDLKTYRTKYIVPLRRKLEVLEQKLCAGEWEDINYERVPSIAGKMYAKAFKKHDSTRYADFLESVKKGEKSMKTGVLMPHQIVAPYILGESQDETLEAQWVSFLADRKSKRSIDILPLVDVSGSMSSGSNPRPIDVAVALGILFSNLNESPAYHRKFITFSSDPKLVSLTGNTLKDQVESTMSASWNFTTNIQAAFDLILNTAKLFDTPAEKMPKILLILSDMQFDQAAEKSKTNWEEIEGKYKDAGYKRPIIVFWNLNGKSDDMPVPNEKVPNCIMLSGYNDTILYNILDGKIPSPIDIIYKTLDSKRYEAVIQ